MFAYSASAFRQPQAHRTPDPWLPSAEVIGALAFGHVEPEVSRGRPKRPGFGTSPASANRAQNGSRHRVTLSGRPNGPGQRYSARPRGDTGQAFTRERGRPVPPTGRVGRRQRQASGRCIRTKGAKGAWR